MASYKTQYPRYASSPGYSDEVRDWIMMMNAIKGLRGDKKYPATMEDETIVQMTASEKALYDIQRARTDISERQVKVAEAGEAKVVIEPEFKTTVAGIEDVGLTASELLEQERIRVAKEKTTFAKAMQEREDEKETSRATIAFDTGKYALDLTPIEEAEEKGEVPYAWFMGRKKSQKLAPAYKDSIELTVQKINNILEQQSAGLSTAELGGESINYATALLAKDPVSGGQDFYEALQGDALAAIEAYKRIITWGYPVQDVGVSAKDLNVSIKKIEDLIGRIDRQKKMAQQMKAVGAIGLRPSLLQAE